MAVGIRVRGEHQQFQIDGTYRNHERVWTGVVNCSNFRFQGVGYGVVSIGWSDPAIPIIAVETNGLDSFVEYRGYSGGVHTYWISVKGSGNVTYHVFAPATSDPSGVGLRIRNGDTGQVVYNSNRKSLRVLEYFNGDYSNPGDPLRAVGGISRVYAGKRIAVSQSQQAWDDIYLPLNPSNPNNSLWLNNKGCSFVRTNTSSLALTYTDLAQQGPLPAGQNYANYSSVQYLYSTLVLDVTGF